MGKGEEGNLVLGAEVPCWNIKLIEVVEQKCSRTFFSSACSRKRVVANTYTTRKAEVGGMQARRTDFYIFNPPNTVQGVFCSFQEISALPF